MVEQNFPIVISISYAHGSIMAHRIIKRYEEIFDSNMDVINYRLVIQPVIYGEECIGELSFAHLAGRC